MYRPRPKLYHTLPRSPEFAALISGPDVVSCSAFAMRVHTLFIPLLLAVLMLSVALIPAQAADDLPGGIVERVDIVGNHRIEATTIRGALGTKPDQPLSRETVRQDIESIFSLGFFDDVVIEAVAETAGVVVTVRVTELPITGVISFAGNKKILKDTLKELAAGLTEGEFLSASQVARVSDFILVKYDDEGFRNASVVPVISDAPAPAGERRVDVVFVIDEGPKTKIRKIVFSGNERYSDRVLTKVIKTKKRFWLTSWLTDSGLYKASQVSEDLLRLEDYYQNSGYLDVVVGEPDVALSDNKRWYKLTYPITEGRPYKIGRVDYQHQGLVLENTLTKDISMRSGDTYDRSQIRRAMASLTDRLGEHGYASSQVSPRLAPNPETGQVDLLFDIEEGEQVYIRRINIIGNDKTRDKVIRREMRQQEGDIINTTLFRRSFQRINNLNFFESVDIEPVPVDEGQLDLDVRVKEKSTGQFSIGGGFSSVDGLVGLLEITQGNFRGKGQTVSGRFERSGRRTVYNLRFREPYLLDSHYSFGFDLFKTERDFESYEENRSGGGINVGRRLGEYTSGSVSYTFEALNLQGLDPSDPNLSAVTRELAETPDSTTGSVGFSLSRDTRDNIFDPRKGTRNVLRMEVAGPYLGGSNDFIKGTLDSSVVVPVIGSSTMTFRGLYGAGKGFGGKRLPPGERFFVGGIHTVRGFDYGEAGPLDFDTDPGTINTLDPVGAEQEVVFTAEFGFPLVKEANLKGALFVDWGAGFARGNAVALSELNLSWGYEIRWISPLGPLRFGFGWVLDDQRPPELRRNGQQLFTIGTFF